MNALKRFVNNSILITSLSIIGIVISMLIMGYVWTIARPVIDTSIIASAYVVGYGFVFMASIAIFCASVVMLSAAARLSFGQWYKLLIGRSEARKALLQSDFEFRTIEAGQQAFVFTRPDSSLIGRPLNLEPGPFSATSLPAADPVSLAKWGYLNAPQMSKGDNSAVPLLESGQAARPLPARIDLAQLMSDRPSLNNLILGVTYDDRIVTESLKNLTHIAIAGVTRFGKSIFTQQLLYQIATAREETRLYLADLGGTTFVDFGLPYASTLGEVEAMVNEVMSEAERRKGLYEATRQGIRSLEIYNQVTGDSLPWLVMVIDEALYLMEKSKAVKENLELTVSWAAKYGISAMVVSQDWKSNIMGSATRNNFSSRFQFLAEDRTQANILVKGCAADRIEHKGRCFARLPGQNVITEIQTPYVSEAEIKAIAPHIQGKGAPVAISNWPTPKEEPEPPPLAKHHPDVVNAAIDKLLAADPETFPTKGQVTESVGILGGRQYGKVIEIYEQRFAEWQKE